MQQPGHAYAGAYGDASTYPHACANLDAGANCDTDTHCHSYSTDRSA